MVERDEDSRNGKRTINGTERKKQQQQQSPQPFVNQFARHIESNVSYAEALLKLRPQGDSGTNHPDGNLSRSYSTPSFDSSAPSTPSLPHSISSPDLESQDSPTENEISLSGHDYSNYSSPATTKPYSGSIKPLYFGRLKSCLSLPKSFPPPSADLKTSSNGKHPSLPPPPPPSPSPSSRISNSDVLREELQRLIKREMESGNSLLTNDPIFNF